MNRADAFLRFDESTLSLPPRETAVDCYHGIDLAPRTLESLVTWDVSGRAQCEQARLNAAYRLPRAMRGGY